MRKLLFVANWNLKSTDGISKKINSQISSLRVKYDITPIIIPLIRSGGISKEWLKSMALLIIANKKGLVYERNTTGITGLLIKIILLIKQFETVYLEIPTYPPEKKNSIISKMEQVIAIYGYRYIYKKILYMGVSNSDFLYGVQSVRIENGVDFTDLRVHKRLKSSGMTLLGVSSLANWHGYDRIINGLFNYKKRDVFFELAGDGPELSRLKQLVADLDLEDRVIFHGQISGAELDLVFDRSDLGVDSLARHRSGHYVNQSLKAREYCARGIPFVKSHSDPVFDGCAFVLTVSCDDSPIDIEEIKRWMKTVKCDQNELRCFALNHFCWTQIYKNAGLL